MYLVLLELLFPLFLSLFLSPFFLTSGIAGIFYLHFQYVGFCRPQNIGKTQKPRCRQRQRGSKTKKGTNTTANPSYVLRKFFFLISCIYYTRFFGKRKFLSDFFRWQQMTTIGIQCSIRQPVQYSSAGIRNPVFRQQLFAARRLFIQANEASRQPLYYLTGQYSPARLIFFTGQISDFRLRTTLLSRRLRRRQPRFRSHKQINKRTFQKNSQKNFKNNSKSNPKEPK